MAMHSSLTEARLLAIKEQILQRIPEGYDDVCISGSYVYNYPRLQAVNFDDVGIIGMPSDLDVLVWYEDITPTKLRFFYDGLVISVKLKRTVNKHEKFYGYKIPQYSLITNELFDWDDNEIQAYLNHKTRPPNRWGQGRE